MLERAMLLAAGLGTRMRPLTDRTPKALLKLGDEPLLAYTLARFETAGLKRVVVNTHHFAEQVAAYLGARSSQIELLLSYEPQLLESGGGLVHALALLGDTPFFCANADTVWFDDSTPALSCLAETYDPDRMDALLLLEPRERAVDYTGPGDFGLNAEGELILGGDRRYIFRGLQALHPRALRGRTATPFSLRDVWRTAQRPDGSIARHFGLVHESGIWLHVGTPNELAKAERVVAALASTQAHPSENKTDTVRRRL